METAETRNPVVICNILNHGHTYDQGNTSFIIAMSRIPWVENITVITPPPNGPDEFRLPDKCKVLPLLEYSRPFSMLSIAYKLRKIKGDPVIIIYGPTAFGESNLSNLFGMLMPYFIKRIAGRKVKIINKGSVYTHNVEYLGYNSFLDRFRRRVVKTIEKFIYKRIETYFYFQSYKNIIDKITGKKKLSRVFKGDYIDAIASVYINGKDNAVNVTRGEKGQFPRILLHGYWGPQKDPESALRAIKTLKEIGLNIDLTLSGGINHHFSGYAEYFNDTLKRYRSTIDRYLGYVREKELTHLFLDNDIVVMPYRASGGQSGVLEMASFFENIVVCTDLPEFREEKRSDLVILTKLENIEEAIRHAISMVDKVPHEINVEDKIRLVTSNISDFLIN